MLSYLPSRYGALFALFFLSCLSLNAQRVNDDYGLRLKLDDPLELRMARVKDSITHYRAELVELEARVKELMGEHQLRNRNTFAVTAPKVYLEVFGQDTGRMILAAVQDYHVQRKRLLRWGYVGRWLSFLNTKNGRKDLFKRYGAKLAERLTTDKKVEELLNNEVVRNAIFYHGWASERLTEGYGTSTASIIKGIDAFRPDGKVPEVSASVTAGGSIPAENIYFSYPSNQQANFYPFEFINRTGKLALRRYPPDNLREAHSANELWARWKSSKGKILYTRAYLGDYAVGYTVPTYFLEPGGFYELSLVRSSKEAFDSFLDFYAKKDIGELIVRDVYHREKKASVPAEVFFRAQFRVSKYGSFFAKTMSHSFELEEGPGTSYRVDLEEPFGPEELTGLHGSAPVAMLSYFNCPAINDVLKRIYGDAAKTFYAHPSQGYVDYLKRNRDSLNVDSLVAIELLPYKERIRKCRRMRMVNAEGKRVSVFSRKLPLGPKPNHRECIYPEGVTHAVSTDIFDGTTPYDDRSGSLVLRDTFAEAVQRIVLEVAPLLEARTEEYADILRQLVELSPQVGAGKDFTEVVRAINPWYLTNPRDERQLSPKPCQPEKIHAGYGFPLGAKRTTTSSFKVRE